MDLPKLQRRLKRSKLVLGNVADTVGTFFEKHNPAPFGAVSYDLDFYSSTVNALRILDAKSNQVLPRVICYFDDTLGDVEFHNDFTGERLAIQEFNDCHSSVKLSPIYYLRATPAAPADPFRHDVGRG